MATLTDKQVELYTELISKRIEEAQGDWKKPWINPTAGVLAQNIDGRAYNGLNRLILNLHAQSKGYEYPVYTSFTRAKDEGVRIQAGERGIPIFYSGAIITDRETGEKITTEKYKTLSQEERAKYNYHPFIRVTTVFNLDQTNIRKERPDLMEKVQSRIEAAKTNTHRIDDRFVSAPLDATINNDKWIVPIVHSDANRAYYNPVDSLIHLPNKESFHSSEDYYATALHEMAHSTEKPLARDMSEYGREELVAELSASIVASQYDFPKHIQENNTQYLKTWLDNIQEDSSFLKGILEDVHKASNFMIKQVENIYQEYLAQSPEKSEDYYRSDSRSPGWSPKEEVMMMMYARPDIIHPALLKSIDNENSELNALAEKKDSLLKEYFTTSDSRTLAKIDMVEDKMRAVLAKELDLPELPTREQKTEIISGHLERMSQQSVATDTNSLVHDATYNDIKLNVKAPHTPELQEKLTADGVDFKIVDQQIEYEARTRYKEGWTLENTPANTELLKKLQIDYTPLGESKLFVSVSEPNIGALYDHKDKLQPIFGMGTLPKLSESTLEKRVQATPQLSDDDKALLIAGKVAIVSSEDNPDRKTAYYIDPELHQIRSIDTKALRIPDQVSGVNLLPEQKEELIKGKEVSLLDRDNHIYLRLTLAPQEHNNLSLEYKTALNEPFKRVPTPESPDHEKKRYIELKGATGIDDIWGREGVKLERDSFLNRYQVQEAYREYLKFKDTPQAVDAPISKEIRELSQQIKETLQSHNNPSKGYSR